ncbi:MAG: hypothetical protein QXP20_02190 [Candidatus Bathyarchaeia archaeon]
MVSYEFDQETNNGLRESVRDLKLGFNGLNEEIRQLKIRLLEVEDYVSALKFQLDFIQELMEKRMVEIMTYARSVSKIEACLINR